MPQTKYHDVTVVRKKTYSRVRVMGVPPEEFGIERQARTIKDCGYCFHRVKRREADLIDEGFDAEDVKALPTYVIQTGVEDLARDSVFENTGTGGDKGINTSNRFVRVVEHYVRMDYEGNGKTKLYRVTTGGEIGMPLHRNGKLECIEVDDIPFASMTPIPITHRFFGRSLADLVMDIQRIKTALFRGLLDNIYLAVNQRPEVAENFAGESTLDDLLVSRPGAPIRVKQPGCVTWQQMPTVADKIIPVMEYVDKEREWRTGVAHEGQPLDPSALQNQSATSAALAFTATQAKMRLIARIFAETGIRDMFALVHETIRKHASEPQVYRLRKQWINVDPREWKRRDDMTIKVGLGSGSKAERLGRIVAIGNAQKELLLGQKTNLVSDANLYNTGKEMVKLSELGDPDEFFTDPATVPPPSPPPPDPKLQIEQMKMQGQQQIEQMKSQHDQQQAQLKASLELQSQQSDAKHQFIKMQADIAMQKQEMEFKAQLALLQHQLKMRESEAKIWATRANALGHNDGPKEDKSPEPDHHMEMMATLLKHVTAPKRIVRDEHGRVSHVETMQ
jgi:hypothetical protein